MTQHSTSVRTTARADTTIRAECIGSRVALRSAQAIVHSVYARACNIETDAGALVTLLTQRSANLPHGVRCGLPARADFQDLFVPSQKVTIGAGVLLIEEAGIAVDLSGASEWRCVMPAVGVNVFSEATHHTLTGLRQILRMHAPAGGLVPLLLRDEAPASAFDLAMHRRLACALPVLRDATLGSDTAAATQAFAQLVGLGPGLTPSGDDFIVGYLAALHSRRAREAGIGLLLASLAIPVARLAAGTNLISRQFILDALEGEFSEWLAELMTAISGHDDARVRVCAAQMLALGHSSGADSIVGVLFGLCPALVLGRGSRSRADAVAALD